MAAAGAHGSKPFQRKKKRSFLSKARKYGRKGQFGRGKSIDEETYSYFIRVFERLKDDFEDDEERDIFVSNVFNQTGNQELDLMSNQVISKVLEKLLPLAKPEILEKFMTIIQSNFRVIATDAYASHVLEKVMGLALERMEDEAATEKHKETCKSFVLSASRFAFNNVEDFITDTYASHILRVAVQCTSGVQITTEMLKSKRSRNHLEAEEEKNPNIKQRPADFLETMEEFGKQIVNFPQLPDLLQSENSSAVIQTVLYALHKSIPKLRDALVERLVNKVFSSMDELVIFSSTSTLHLLEVCLSVANEANFESLYAKYFRGKILKLATNTESKYAVVKLFSSLKDVKLFNEAFDELAGYLEDIFASDCGSVVLAVAEACKRLVAQQAVFVQHLMQCFHCYEPESRQQSIVPLISRLVTFEVANDDAAQASEKITFPVHYIGSQLIQNLLFFQKPIKIVNSLLSMSSSDLVDLLSDPCGSFIMDAFVQSTYVGEKSREKLAHKLEGSYFPLACSKHGSRALDSLWNVISVKARSVVGTELLEKEAALSSNNFGRILSNKYALPLLKRQNADWVAVQEKEGKKRKLFADLVGTAGAEGKDAPEEPPKKKKKKKQEKDEQ